MPVAESWRRRRKPMRRWTREYIVEEPGRRCGADLIVAVEVSAGCLTGKQHVFLAQLTGTTGGGRMAWGIQNPEPIDTPVPRHQIALRYRGYRAECLGYLPQSREAPFPQSCGVQEMGTPLVVDQNLEARVCANELAKPSRVVDVNVSQEDVIDPSHRQALKALKERRDAARRTGVHQHGPVQAGAHHEAKPAFPDKVRGYEVLVARNRDVEAQPV